jgi:hypothetical protein
VHLAEGQFPSKNRIEQIKSYNNNNINNLIQFFIIIYVPSQLPKGQLQTQHSLDTGNYIICKPKLQARTGGRK